MKAAPTVPLYYPGFSLAPAPLGTGGGFGLGAGACAPATLSLARLLLCYAPAIALLLLAKLSLGWAANVAVLLLAGLPLLRAPVQAVGTCMHCILCGSLAGSDCRPTLGLASLGGRGSAACRAPW